MSQDAQSNGNQPPWFSGQSGGSHPSIPPGPPVREDQVVQAIRFLQDSRTQSASQQEKESFLRQKGLTDGEIAAAISRSTAPQSSLPFQENAIQRPIYVPPPVVEEPILWSAIKSIFGAVGAIAIGVIGYQYYLESTSKSEEKQDNRDSLVSPWRSSSPDDQVSFERMERLAASVEALKSEQALRHKELILSIRELTSVMKETRGRKPGGTVVMDDIVEQKNKVTTSDPLPKPVVVDVFTEPVDMEAEVASLRDLGIDSTMQFILSSLDKNKKLNKTNPRFAKFAGNKLLRLVGFKEDGEFFTLGEVSSQEAEKIIAEIKRQRGTVTSTESPSPGQQLPPWLVPKPPPPAPEIEELNP